MSALHVSAGSVSQRSVRDLPPPYVATETGERRVEPVDAVRGLVVGLAMASVLWVSAGLLML